MNDVTILVGTLDPYNAAWPVFCHGMSKYWPELKWPVKAATNGLDFPCGDGLKVGAYKDWAQNTRRSLERLDTPVVLWMLEDSWLTAVPDTEVLSQFAQHIVDGKADYIRLINSNAVTNAGLTSFDDRLFVFSKTSKYRTSLCPSIWNRQVFIDLLKQGESIWDFEVKGTVRSRDYMFCCTNAWDWIYLPIAFPSKNSEWSSTPITRGKWTGSAKKYVAREGLSVDFSQHPISGIL